MGKFYKLINKAHRAFIQDQNIFFVGTAPLNSKGRVNLSPKGLDSFKVLSDQEVGYMDLISSGNETSAHTLENGRITIMFCSFDKEPRILRLYGKGRAVLRDSVNWAKYEGHFKILPSIRQLIIATIDLVQTSCGFGVPKYKYLGERNIHHDWAEKKGAEGLLVYIQENNLTSLDGLPTDLNNDFLSDSGSHST